MLLFVFKFVLLLSWLYHKIRPDPHKNLCSLLAISYIVCLFVCLFVSRYKIHISFFAFICFGFYLPIAYVISFGCSFGYPFWLFLWWTNRVDLDTPPPRNSWNIKAQVSNMAKKAAIVRDNCVSIWCIESTLLLVVVSNGAVNIKLNCTANWNSNVKNRMEWVPIFILKISPDTQRHNSNNEWVRHFLRMCFHFDVTI